MLNPLDEQRPLAQLVILGLIYVAVTFAQRMMGSTVAIGIAVVAVLFLPASVAVLGLERNILKAAYPVAWVRLVMGLGPMYAPRSRGHRRLLTTYSIPGEVGSLVAGANRHIHVLHSVGIQRSRRVPCTSGATNSGWRPGSRPNAPRNSGAKRSCVGARKR